MKLSFDAEFTCTQVSKV